MHEHARAHAPRLKQLAEHAYKRAHDDTWALKMKLQRMCVLKRMMVIDEQRKSVILISPLGILTTPRTLQIYLYRNMKLNMDKLALSRVKMRKSDRKRMDDYK